MSKFIKKSYSVIIGGPFFFTHPVKANAGQWQFFIKCFWILQSIFLFLPSLSRSKSQKFLSYLKTNIISQSNIVLLFLWSIQCNWHDTQANKSNVNEVNFERAKCTLKMLLASWFLMNFFERFRSFNSVNIGSVDRRA